MDLHFTFSPKKTSLFLRKYSIRIGYLILLAGVIYILIFLYQYLYLPISEKQTIDPSLIQSKKEVVNQQLFERIIKSMEQKTTSFNDSLQNIRDPF
ncbi:MAG: hypothetical protein COY66_00125 [Candidatus Kerfeldbacteria bacterium CG_4_10_14_0_8_um_filter_42_10]|uniref:Uncharacterized protein n=1 Tax=Candidatus Kerfeldbacteria bacterium CG_4_10_14_0_8_um_filter_42_10 TaxID=2014248 RepID=A0A2M7RKL8_9BACT|nr:MAG: hypothetical protein COY66_00125 [Candidatus Kerfeldbacteria bacterium CG_4_10_14_0_8_um_filter_42_10]